VDARASRARRLDRRGQVFPRGEPSAEVALRQLEQHRADRVLQPRDVVGGDEPIALAEERCAQTVQPLVAALLVHVDVAKRMEGDEIASGPARMDAQGDLLRHRPARHPNGRFLPEEARDAPLEPLRERSLPVAVGVAQLRRPLGEREERGVRIALARVEADRVSLAARPHLT
jgi:hypothetical protein